MRRLAATLAVATTLLAVLPVSAQRPGARPSIRQARGTTVRVQLVDARSARPLANADVQIASDNGIRCIRAPCPTNARRWGGRSDATGYVVVPTSIIQQATTISAGRASGDLVQDSEPGPGGAWVAELMPEDTTELSPRPLKLVDARSGRPLAHVRARLQYPGAGGRPAELRLTTNALGWILVPFEVVARGADNTYVEVPGYRRTHVDYSWVHRRTELKKRLW